MFRTQTHSSILEQGVAVMFLPQKVVEDIIMALTCCVPQSCPTILGYNLKKVCHEIEGKVFLRQEKHHSQPKV